MKDKQKGILTIEASIVLCFCTLIVLFLLSFARIYTAQSIVSHAVLQASDAVALESYLRESSFQGGEANIVEIVNRFDGETTPVSADSFKSLRTADVQKIAKEKFVYAISKSEAEADQKLKNVGVKDGLAGVNFGASRIDLGNDDVVVHANYTIELQFPVFGWQEISVTKAAKSKTFGDILFGIETIANNPIMGSAHGGGQYKHGTSVQISATPNYGYKFVKWNDGSTANPRTVTVTGSHTYIAEFEACNFGVTLLVNKEGAGAVKGAGEYTYLDNITVEAIPEKGYHFDKWTVFRHNEHTTKTVKTALMPIVVDQSYTCRAYFEPNEYTISVVTDGTTGGKASIVYNGSTSQSSVTAKYGTSFKLSAPKVTGSEFKGWKIQGENNYFSNSSSVNLDVPAKNITYIAVYKTIPSIKISGGFTGGNSTRLKATTIPPGQKVKWHTSNGSVLSVSDGKVTAKGNGKAVVTASIEYEGKIYTSNKITIAASKSIKIEHFCRRDGSKVRHYYKYYPGPNYNDTKWAPAEYPGVWHRDFQITYSELNQMEKNGYVVGNNYYNPEYNRSRNLFKKLQGTNLIYQTQWGYNDSGETGYIYYYGPYYGMFFVTEKHAPKPGGGYYDYYISSIK
ncbi:MAG: hypothetical protein IJD93_00755 [Ruminococcus sp.]|nr:hypothetical protein [Ruminococcus sp.]